MANEFYVYSHARPDGSIFYIGKGSGRRASQMSPSRRTLHHTNIVRKYGLQNIKVEVTYCESEEAAFTLEKELIAKYRPHLINLTDGGEGAAGHVANEAQRAALAKGRLPGKNISPESRARMTEGSRKAHLGVRISDEQKTKMLAGRTAVLAEGPKHECVCTRCGVAFLSHRASRKCCSKLCDQQHRRAGEIRAPIESTCICCGEKVARLSYSVEFCSQKCRKLHTGVLKDVRTKEFKFICSGCGVETIKHSHRAKYCSIDCRQRHHQKEETKVPFVYHFICPGCQAKVEARSTNAKYCSVRCRVRHRKIEKKNAYSG